MERTGPLELLDLDGSLSADERGMLTSLREVYRKALELDGLPEGARAVARRRLEQTERGMEMLEGGRRPPGRVLRSVAAPVAKRVLARRYWYPQTPPEVAAAFPHLAGGRT